MARRQRRELSLPAVLLWQRLRRNALGARVRNQHPIGPYVVDFYIAAEILQDADAVASSIASLAGLPLHQPAAGPPPRSGEDLSAPMRADQE